MGRGGRVSGRRGEGFVDFCVVFLIVVGEVRGCGGRKEETSRFFGGGAVDGGDVRGGGGVGGGVGFGGRGESLTWG